MSSLSQFQEDYALRPESRPDLVKGMTPGTEEYFLYRLRHLSQQLQTAEIPITAQVVDEATALIKAAKSSDVITDPTLINQLTTQIALLAFPVKPEMLLKELAFDAGLINVSQATLERAGEEDAAEEETSSHGVEHLPTTLDQNIFNTEVLTEKMLDAIQNNFYGIRVLEDVWPYLFTQPKMEAILEEMDLDQLLMLFMTMQITYSPKSLEIVAKADSSRFDQVVLKIILRLYEGKKIAFEDRYHQFKDLTRAQLDALKAQQGPALMNDKGFVGLLEQRIVPEPFPENEERAKKAWLDRMVAFVDELPPKYNRHKLSVYLMSLEHDLAKGVMDKAKFLRYVAIPRNQEHYNQQTLKNHERDVQVDLSYPRSLECWSNRVTTVENDRDEEIVEEYLSHFMRESKSSAEFEEFFELKSFLDPLLARVMLTSGDKDIAKWSGLLPADENLAQLAEKTILKFAPDNPAKFLPSDPVVFKLRAKNAKRILVRVFEIKTFDYLQQNDGSLIMGQNLNLDGLTPNWEHNLVLNHPALEIHDVKIELPELANRRGAFVMDVISNGENSSVYFTKGCLDFVERQSVAGHVLTVIDENQEKRSEKCTIWLNGYYYKPNGDGDIIIPYRKPNSSSNSFIYLIHDGFTTRREFNHRFEGYTLKLACHIDDESFVAGSIAKILVKPTVQIKENTVVCPVSLLEQVQLSVAYHDTNNILTTTTVPDFKVHDVDWSEYNFQVPENFSKMFITLSAKVKVISTGEYEDLKAESHFEIDSPRSDQNVNFEQNGLWQTVRIPGEIVTLLQKHADDDYRILALGRNGEKRPDIPLEFEVTHPLSLESLKVYLRTDDDGQAQLGPLHDIEKLGCTTTSSYWQLSEREHHAYPDQIHSVEGELISLPFGQHDLATIRKISLFSVSGRKAEDGNNRCSLDDYTNNIRLSNGLLTVKGLKAGYYVFQIADKATCQLTITHAGATRSKIQGLEDFVIGSNPMLEVVESTKHPLYMAKPVADAENRRVDIQLYNWSPETRVCVFASKFVPFRETLFNRLMVLENEDPWVMRKTELTPTSFKTGRVLGEEYQYILNRKAQKNHWAGNLLTKPSALLSPWAVADTSMSKQVMQQDLLDDVQMVGSRGMPMACRMMASSGKMVGVSSIPSRAHPLLNFLVHPSVVLANLIPDASTGVVSIPYSTFKEGTFLEIFVCDGHQAAQQSFVIPRPVSSEGADPLDFQTRDLRFKSALDHTKHYIGERTGIDLDPKLQSATSGSASPASVTLASNGSSSSAVRVINSVSQVYDLMLTLLASEDHKQSLRKFGFITDWHRLSDESKKKKFSQWNCHELNLFLYKKDREFFDVVVAPFLKNKLIKSFMDNYLIGASLSEYVALSEFNQLTCMEKCLLADRVPTLKAAVAQWIKDRMRNTRAASNVKLFLTVMNSGNLKESSYTPTSPAYSPTSASYVPTSASYVPTSVQQSRSFMMEEEDSDEDMGFALLDMPESAPQSMLYSAVQPESEEMAVSSMPEMKKKSMARRTNVIQDRSRSERIVQSQFKLVDLTKEMAETFYYGRQDFKADNSDDEVNAFWLDLANWDDALGGSFLSQNFVANTGSFTDAMATIALLDVTFRPKDASLTRSASHNLVISSQSPGIVFHSSTKELTETPVTGSVLVTQQYFEQTEKTVYDEVLMSDVRHYIQPSSEFRPLESYGAHVVLMNATPNPMKVHLELQLPQGSISAYGSLESGQDIQLRPHGTFQYEYGFYFPEEGDFPHYPAHVSNYEDIIAHASPTVLKVRTPEPGRRETADTGTWVYLLKHGTKDDILNKLKTSPLSSLPVEQLLPRLYKDRRFLQQVTSTLRARQEYHDRIWYVALATQNLELVKEFLMNQSQLSLSVGDWFESAVYERKPRSRLEGSWDGSLQYLEYFPLINARAHKATRKATILNNKFKDQYAHFLQYLSQKPRHDVDDLLVLIVYLLAQDRIEEAKEKFRQLSNLMKPSGHPSREYFQQLQYDYLWAYLSLCVEVQVDAAASDLSLDLKGVQEVLNKYKDHPLDRWNQMFKDMQTYVDEINQSMVEVEPASEFSAAEGSTNQQDTKTTTDGEDEEDDMAPEVPVSVDFKIGNENALMVRHRGVREVTVEYYSIDAEIMFSASPLTLSDQGESESSDGSSSMGATPFGFSGSNATTTRKGDSSNSYRLVKPNGTDCHSVKRAVENDGILMIPILPQYLNTNVMISVSTFPPAATRTWKAYYSQTILVQCLERTGTMRVISKADGRPIRGAYVKAYAEMKEGGEAVFWKDGYTDLVGRFAYASVSTGTGGSAADGGLGGVKRFAVFVDGGREGCVVKNLPVPPV